MRILFVALAVMLAGCSVLQPPVDVCAAYEQPAHQSYCYVDREVTAAAKAVTQSYRDGAITREQALKARDVLRRADEALDRAEALLVVGDQSGAQVRLESVRQILLEVH